MLITLLKGYSKSTFTGQKKDVDLFLIFRFPMVRNGNNDWISKLKILYFNPHEFYIKKGLFR